ncbi:MAG: trypsin-like peptidase domain-containing protein [Flavobacteriaceae bacterium]
MKKFFSFLSIAILGGIITLGGYKAFIEEPVVIEKSNEQPLQTFQTNFKSPEFEAILSTYAPTSFTEAAEKTVHAVVHVKNTAIKSSINSWNDFFNGPRKYEQVGTGSGVIISADGYIVTNNHVIDGATNLEITLNNQKKYEATLIGTDSKNDIALLKIEADDSLPYIPFSDSDNVRLGEWVLAVGNPYNLTSTVTAGIVSAKGRDLEGNGDITDSFIQTDAAVNPGNSGGALVNTRGELVGINTAITSKTGSFVGYSFAIPSNITKKIIDDILEFGSVQEAILGFVPDLSMDLDGVKIGNLPDDSGAKIAGLRSGDIIKRVNNIKISKFSELSGQLKAKRPGEYVDITVERNGKQVTKKVKLSKRDTFVSRNFGVILKDLNKKELKSLSIDSGVKITRNVNRALSYYGVEEGYILVSINKIKVSSAALAAETLDKAVRSRSPINLEIMNKDGVIEKYNLK